MHMASVQLARHAIPLQCQLDTQLICLNLLQFYIIPLKTEDKESKYNLQSFNYVKTIANNY